MSQSLRQLLGWSDCQPVWSTSQRVSTIATQSATESILISQPKLWSVSVSKLAVTEPASQSVSQLFVSINNK